MKGLISMKNLMSSFLVFAVVSALYSAPEDELAQNLQMQSQLKEKDARLASVMEENRKSEYENKNMQMSIGYMKAVLESIKSKSPSPAPPVLLSSEDGKKTLLSLTMQESDIQKTLGISGKNWLALVDEPDGKKALKIHCDPADLKEKRCVTIWLKDNVQGQKLRCSAMVRGENISTAQGSSTSKLLLMIPTPTKTLWPDVAIGTGTFAWKEVSFTTDLPFDAKGAMLMFGLQGVSGTIYFRDIKVESIGN